MCNTSFCYPCAKLDSFAYQVQSLSEGTADGDRRFLSFIKTQVARVPQQLGQESYTKRLQQR